MGNNTQLVPSLANVQGSVTLADTTFTAVELETAISYALNPPAPIPEKNTFKRFLSLDSVSQISGGTYSTVSVTLPAIDQFEQDVNTIIPALEKAANEDESFLVLTIPKDVKEIKGFKPLSVGIVFKVSTSDLNNLSVAFFASKLVSGQGGGTTKGNLFSFTFDEGDSLSKAVTSGIHIQRKNIVLSEQDFLTSRDEILNLKIFVDAAADSVFQFFGVELEYEMDLGE